MDKIVKEIIKTSLGSVHSKEQETRQFLVMVGRFAELLPLDLGVQQLCRELVRIIIEETSFENCSILIWDAQNGSLSLAAADGLEDLLGVEATPDYNEDLGFALQEGLAGQAFAGRSPIFVEDSTQQPIPFKVGSVVRPTSIACIPLLEAGVLNISSYHPQQFTVQSRRYWEIIGKILGSFLHGVLMQSVNESGRQDSLEAPHHFEMLTSEEDHGPTESVLLTEDALQHIPLGVCILDAEGNVTKVNRSIERSYGGSASELIGRPPSVIFHDPGMFQELFEKTAFSQAEEMGDVSLVNANGEIYSADLNLVRMMGKNEAVKGYLLVINDVTKKKAFASKILQAEKRATLGTMAGGVAHDFNNQLMAILGNLELISPQIQDEEILRRLKRIEKAVHDGANTVRLLQKFTERELHRKATPVAADINEAIKDVVEMTRPRWKNAMEKDGHSIQVEMDLGPQCFSSINVSDFREALTNLVFNAIDAMPQGGIITISSRPLGDMVVIEVADTGIGMSQELTAKIFDPFYTTKGIGNSGLGLSVSWNLITRCGGEILAKSKPGKGSRFTIRLPKAEPPQRVLPVLDTATPPHGQRLLLVDDDEEVLGIVRDMLRLQGYRVAAVADGKKALEIIDKQEFDLVITDLGMPDISGWEIATRVKGKNAKTPVVLLTGWGVQHEEVDLSKEGVDLVLSKPLSAKELTEAIGELLQNTKLNG